MYLFLTGLILGILIVNIGQHHWMTEEGLLNPEMVDKMKRSMPDGGSLFPYIFRSRILCVGILLLLSFTVLGIFAVGGYLIYAGFSAGCLLSVAAIRYGVRGIALVAAGVMPQGIFLIPGFLLLFGWGADSYQLLHGYRGMVNMYLKGDTRTLWVRKGLQLGVILLLILSGCLLESYVNPKAMQMILKIF